MKWITTLMAIAGIAANAQEITPEAVAAAERQAMLRMIAFVVFAIAGVLLIVGLIIWAVKRGVVEAHREIRGEETNR